MDEQDFDSLFAPRPFGTAEAMREDARLRRSATLGIALWGRTSDDLQRQLLAPYPEYLRASIWRISGRCSGPLSGFHSMLASSTKSVVVGFPFLTTPSPAIFVSTQRFAPWEACCEILRRAIEHLENTEEGRPQRWPVVPDQPCNR